MAAEAVIRNAVAANLPAIAAISKAPYEDYITRIGKRPEPMDADVCEPVQRGQVFVLELGADIPGYIIIYADDGSQLIENVSVAPEFQGQGFGARLLAFAEVEAARNSLPRLFLCTNVKMTENLEYYPRLGYKEYKRALNQGFERVLFEKRLGP